MTKPFTWVLAGLVVVGLILASVAPALADDPGLCRGVPGSVVLDVVADPLADIYVLLGGAIGNQTQADFFLQRYGGPCVGDPTFGNGGVVSDRVDGNTINVVNSVAVGPGGIITRGITKPTQFSPGTYTKSLYSPQGTLLMRAFDETVMDFNPVALANLLDGTSNTLIFGDGLLMGRRVIVVKSEDQNLNRDPSYGDMGNASINFDPNIPFASWGAVQNDGTSVVAGAVVDTSTFRSRGFLISLNAAGTLQRQIVFNYADVPFSAMASTKDDSVSAVVPLGLPPAGGLGGGCTTSLDGSEAVVFRFGMDLTVDRVTTLNVVPGNGRMPGDGCQPFAVCVNPNDLTRDTFCVNGGQRIIDAGPANNSAQRLAVRGSGFVLAGNSCDQAGCSTFYECFSGDLSDAACPAAP